MPWLPVGFNYFGRVILWMSKRNKVILCVLVSIVALALIIRATDWERLKYALAQANYWWLGPFLVVETVSIWARGMRWRVLLQKKVTWERIFWITNVGYFLNGVLPLRMGELARVYLVSRNSEVGGMQALSTAVLERMIDLLMVFVFLFAVLPWVPDGGILPLLGTQLIGIVFMAMVGLFIAARWRDQVVNLVARWNSWLHPRVVAFVVDHIGSFLGHVQAVKGTLLVSAVVWTAASWMLSAAAIYLLLLGFEPSAQWHVGVFATCVISLGLAIPSAPSSVGIWEGATIFALGMFGIESETALAFAVVMHITIFMKMLVLGMVGIEREGESFRRLANEVNRFTKTLSHRTTHVP